MTAAAPLILHASAVAVDGHACLITGASGTGKSTLAIEMIALGARLVADDRSEVHRAGNTLWVTPPAPISGLIEARGVGLIRVAPARPAERAELALIVDLDQEAGERLPNPRHRDLLGLSCPVILGGRRTGLASILCLALRHGLVDTG